MRGARKERFEDYYMGFFSNRGPKNKHNAETMKRRLKAKTNQDYLRNNKDVYRNYILQNRDPSLLILMEYALYEPHKIKEYLKDLEILYEIYNRGKVDKDNIIIRDSLNHINHILKEIYFRGPYSDKKISKIKVSDYKYLLDGITKQNIYKKLVSGLRYGNKNEERTEIAQEIDIATLDTIETLEKMDVIHNKIILGNLNDELHSENDFLRKFIKESKKKFLIREIVAIKKVLKLIKRRVDRIANWEHDDTKEVREKTARTFSLLFDTIELTAKHPLLSKDEELLSDIESAFKSILYIVKGPAPELIDIFINILKENERNEEEYGGQVKSALSMLGTLSEFTESELFSQLKIFADIKSALNLEIQKNASKALIGFSNIDSTEKKDWSYKKEIGKSSEELTIGSEDLKRKLAAENLRRGADFNDENVFETARIMLQNKSIDLILPDINRLLSTELSKDEPNQGKICEICQILTISARMKRSDEPYDESLIKLDLLIKNMLDESKSPDAVSLIFAVDAMRAILTLRRSNLENMLIGNLNRCLKNDCYGVQCSAMETLDVLATRGSVKGETANIIATSPAWFYELKTIRQSIKTILDIVEKEPEIDDEGLKNISKFLIDAMAIPDQFVCTHAVDAYSILASRHEVSSEKVENKEGGDPMDGERALPEFFRLLEAYPKNIKLRTNISKAVYYTANIVYISKCKFVLTDILDNFLKALVELDHIHSFFWTTRAIGMMASKGIYKPDSVLRILKATSAIKAEGQKHWADESMIREMYEAIDRISSKLTKDDIFLKDKKAHREIRIELKKTFGGLGIDARGFEPIPDELSWAEVHNLCKASSGIVNAGVWKYTIEEGNEDFQIMDFMLVLSKIIVDANNTSAIYWAEKTISGLLDNLSLINKKDSENREDEIDGIRTMLEAVGNRRKGYSCVNRSRPSDYGVRAQAMDIIYKTVGEGKLISYEEAPHGIFDNDGDSSWGVQNPEIKKHTKSAVKSKTIFSVTELEGLAARIKDKDGLSDEEIEIVLQDIREKRYIVGILRFQLKLLDNAVKATKKMKRRKEEELSFIKKLEEPLAVMLQDQIELHDMYLKNEFKTENYDYCILAESCKVLNSMVRLRGFKSLRQSEKNLNLLGLLNKIIQDVPDYGAIKYALRTIEGLAEKNIVSERTVDIITESLLSVDSIEDQSVIRDAVKAAGAIFAYLKSNVKYLTHSEHSDFELIMLKLTKLLNKKAGNDSEMRFWIAKSILSIAELGYSLYSEEIANVVFDLLGDNNPTVRRMASQSISMILTEDIDEVERAKYVVRYLKGSKSDRNSENKELSNPIILRKLECTSDLAKAGYKFTDAGMSEIISFFYRHKDNLVDDVDAVYEYIFSTFTSHNALQSVSTIEKQNEILKAYLESCLYSKSTPSALKMLKKSIVDGQENIPIRELLIFIEKVLKSVTANGKMNMEKIVGADSEENQHDYISDVVISSLDILFYLVSMENRMNGYWISEGLLDSLACLISEPIANVEEYDLGTSREELVRRSIIKEALHIMPHLFYEDRLKVLTPTKAGELIGKLGLHLNNTKNTSVIFFTLHSARSVIERMAYLKNNLQSAEESMRLPMLIVSGNIKKANMLLSVSDRGIMDQSLWIINAVARFFKIFDTHLYGAFKLVSMSNIKNSPNSLMVFSKALSTQISTLTEAVKECDNNGHRLSEFTIDEYSDLIDSLDNVRNSLIGFTKNTKDKKMKEVLQKSLDVLNTKRNDILGHNPSNFEEPSKVKDYRKKMFCILSNNICNESNDLNHKYTELEIAMAKKTVTLFSDILTEKEAKPGLDELLKILKGVVNRYDGALAMRLMTGNPEALDSEGKKKVLDSLVGIFKNQDGSRMGKHYMSITTESILRIVDEDTVLSITAEDALNYVKVGNIYFWGCVNLLKAINKCDPKNGWPKVEKTNIGFYLDVLEMLLELRYDTFDEIGSQLIEELCISIGRDRVAFTVDDANEKCVCTPSKNDKLTERMNDIFKSLMVGNYNMDTKNKAVELILMLEKKKAIKYLPIHDIFDFLFMARRIGDSNKMATALKTLGRVESFGVPDLYEKFSDILDYDLLDKALQKDYSAIDAEFVNYYTSFAEFSWNLGKFDVLNKKAVGTMKTLLDLDASGCDDMKIMCMNTLMIYSQNGMLLGYDSSAPEQVLEKKCFMEDINKRVEIEKLAAIVLVDMIDRGIVNKSELSGETRIRIDTLTRNA